MRLLLLFTIFMAHQSFAQSFYLFEDHRFFSEQIKVVNISKEVITVHLLFESSERCACEPEVAVELKKKSNGTYVGHPYGYKEEVVTAKLVDGKVESLTVHSETYGCCSISDGTYLKKKAKKR